MTAATSSDGSSVGVRDLKNRLSAYLERVKRGEAITVTEHGRPIARLVAVDADVDRLAGLVAAGIVRSARSPRRAARARVKLSRGASLAEVVAEQRR